MFNLEQSIIYIMENVATVSNAEYETRMNINYIWAVIKEFSPILSSLIALYVAWSNQRFNENQKLKDLKNGYCNKYISDYIKLRQCVEDLQYKAYELLAYADTPDEIGEKFRQFELLKEKIVIIYKKQCIVLECWQRYLVERQIKKFVIRLVLLEQKLGVCVAFLLMKLRRLDHMKNI